MQDLIWQKLSLNSFHMLTCVCSLKSKSSYVSKAYSKPNNKYSKSYDPKQKPKHIIYLDTNCLYGYAMSKFLPTGVFKWIDTNEFDLNNTTKIVPKVVFQKLIFNIVKNYTNYTLIIL